MTKVKAMALGVSIFVACMGSTGAFLPLTSVVKFGKETRSGLLRLSMQEERGREQQGGLCEAGSGKGKESGMFNRRTFGMGLASAAVLLTG